MPMYEGGMGLLWGLYIAKGYVQSSLHFPLAHFSMLFFLCCIAAGGGGGGGQGLCGRRRTRWSGRAAGLHYATLGR